MDMHTFFDTSAVVPLLLEEPHSNAARIVWAEAGRDGFAWRWLKVETEAALTRRRAGAKVWQAWERLEFELNWIELPDRELEAVCRFNRSLGLRAADAAHLFVAERLSRAFDPLMLATFDQDMSAGAMELGLKLAV
ncbi:MAG: PIN domain-containing protein [Puniceicoccaceae bacterium]|nr:MAG: PIN domain-containing protein [Puniceicoccaceae bacterium]